MSNNLQRANVVSRTYSGNVTIPKDQNRGYLLIVVVTGTATVELGGGGGKIPLPTGTFYEPTVAPISEIVIEVAGEVVVATTGNSA